MRTLSARRKFWTSAAFIVLAVSSTRPARGEDVKAQLKRIADGYTANREAFTHGRCRFTYSLRSARTEEDALAGRWLEPKRESHGTETYTLFFKDDMLVLRYEPEESTMSLYGLNVVKKGDFAIDAEMGAAIVHSPTRNRLNIRMHPFNLAKDSDFNPDKAIAYAQSKGFEGIDYTIEAVTLNEKERLRVKCHSQFDSHDSIWYVDPSRGYLSDLHELYQKNTGMLYSRMRLLKVHQQGDACFPMHAIAVTPRTHREGPPYVDVREMKVLELDLDHVPTPADLTGHFPPDTQYSDGIDPYTAKTLFGGVKSKFAPVSVDDIEPIFNRLQVLAHERRIKEGLIRSKQIPN